MNLTRLPFRAFLKPNKRPYLLGPMEDADLVGMRLYGEGPFHRECKAGIQIRKKTHFQISEGDIIYNKLFAWKGTLALFLVSWTKCLFLISSRPMNSMVGWSILAI